MPTKKRRVENRAERESSLSSPSRDSKTKDVEPPKTQKPDVYLAIDKVLKPTAPNLDPDDFPVYLLEAVTVFRNGTDILESLLSVDLDGTVEVRGRVAIQPDELEFNDLKNPQRNDQLIVFKCDQFSIGWGPNVIWALGDGRWFEINPSDEYEDIYAKMAEGIAFYYQFTLMYEKMAKKLNTFSIDAVLQLMAEVDGNNTTLAIVRKRMKRHASFVLTEMVKRKGCIHWIRTKLCNWLIVECPGTHRAVLEKSNLIPASDLTASEPPQLESTPTATPTATHTKHSRRQITTKEPYTNVDVIFRTMEELRKEELRKPHPAPNKIAITAVWSALYHDLHLDLPEAKVIARHYAKDVLNLLDRGVWGESQVYKDLKFEVALADPSSEESKNMADILAKMTKKQRNSHDSTARARDFARYGGTVEERLRPRRAVVDRQPPTKKGSARSSATPAASDGNSPSLPSLPSGNSKGVPQPTRSGKSVLAMPRGKNAILRPTGTAATQPLHSADDDGDIPAPRSKKRKTVEAEMGDVSDNESTYGVTGYGADDGDEASEEDVIDPMLIDVQLPSTQPTGPSGTWVCIRAGCSTVIHDSSSLAGQRAKQEHLHSHLDPDVMMYLIKSETDRQGNFETKHLLEKIREIGARNRQDEEADKSSTLQMLKPVKRANV